MSDPERIDGPSPAQIAARAWALAVEAACIHVGLNPAPGVEGLKAFMDRARPVHLAQLRQSIVEPSAIPWWRHK